MNTKKCYNKNCKHKGVLQPTSNFYKKTMTKDGLNYECIDCQKDRRLIEQEKQKERLKGRFSYFIG